MLLAYWVCPAKVIAQLTNGADRERAGSLKRSSGALGAIQEALTMDQLDSVITQAARSGDTLTLAKAYLKKGVLEHKAGDQELAIDHYYKAQVLFEAIGNDAGLAQAFKNIGSIHHYQKDYEKARDYYTRGLRIQERLDSPRDLAVFYNNFGSLAESMGDATGALIHYERSLRIWKQLNDTTWEAVCYANMGLCHDRRGQRDTARLYLRRSLDLLDERVDHYLFGMACNQMGTTYLEDGPYREAIRWCTKGWQLARIIQNRPLEQGSCECLYRAYAQLGDDQRELIHYRRFVELRDSLYGNERTKDITRLEMAYGFQREQLADSLRRTQEQLVVEQGFNESIRKEQLRRNVFMVAGFGTLAFALGLWSRLRYIRRSRAEVQAQRDRADALLNNILPSSVAKELLEKGKAEAREYAMATVLFTDFQRFTQIAEQLSAAELVDAIDRCFKAFDEILGRHGVEKIKTVGDAYMACGGVPDPGRGSPGEVILAALEMQLFIQGFAQHFIDRGVPPFAMRVGIHTGPVVAGVVGSHKFAFDIWGDTVNIAARMESCGEVGRVNISASTHQLVKDDPQWRFEDRGLIEAKGKGMLHMYWVERM